MMDVVSSYLTVQSNRESLQNKADHTDSGNYLINWPNLIERISLNIMSAPFWE